VVLILTGHTLKDSAYTIDYHRGALLTGEELAGATPAQRSQHAALAKPPMVLEADSDTVLRALEPYMQPARHPQPV
jgi:threonine synthase